MIKMLQTTATAAGEMFTGGFHPMFRGGYNLGSTALVIVTLLVIESKRHFFSGQSSINKAGFTIDTPNTATVITKVNNVTVQGLLVAHGGTLFFYWRDNSRSTQSTRDMNHSFGLF